jgi:hypothetical protein
MAQLPRVIPFSLLRPVIQLQKLSKFSLAHDAFAAALLHKHHSIIHIGMAFIQIIDGLPLQLAADANHEKNLFSTGGVSA